MYTLTQDDVELLARIAGGFNFNLSEDPSLDAGGRFKARVLLANADALSTLVARISAPVIVEAGPINLAETQDLLGDPWIWYTQRINGDGRYSVEVSGSPAVKFAVGRRGEFDPARTTYGAGSGPVQAAKAGEWGTWQYTAETGGRNMRPQLLAP